MAPFLGVEAVMPSSQVDIIQEDFSAGIVRDKAPHLIPENGVWDSLNFLLEPDGTSLFRRGGSAYKSNAAFGSGGLTLLWDGYLDPGQRTFFANSADFGVLDADDATPINLGSAGLTYPKQAAVAVSEPDPSFPSLLLFIGGGFIYGGSRKGAAYSTGTVSINNGSRTLTGVGTSFSANVDAGMLLQFGNERVYVVQSVDSNTQITLAEKYSGANKAGAAYSLKAVVQIAPADPYPIADSYCVAGNRLLALVNNRIKFSAIGNPHSFGANDFHTVPEGVTGLGIATIGPNVLIFTTGGIWVFQGVPFDIVDAEGNPQHRILPLSRDLVLWGGPAGIATWENYLVVPCTSGIYLLDGVGSPVRISRTIEPLYQGYVNSAYRTGASTVYRESLLLPILRDNSGQVFELLVCRLDRSFSDDQGRTAFPWTRLGDSGSNVRALTVRIGSALQQPKLLGASVAGRVLDCTAFFKPDAARKSDADGVAHRAIVITRDIPTGNATVNNVRSLRPRAQIDDSGTDNPTMLWAYSDGSSAAGALWDQVEWDNFVWAGDVGAAFRDLNCVVPVNGGASPYRCRVNKRLRYVRLRGTTNGPSAQTVLRSIQLSIRLSEAVRK